MRQGDFLTEERRMKIIMLAGEGQRGKTTTLLNVYKRLSNNIKPIYYEKVDGTTPEDIECYPLYYNDKKVALCTAGDKWFYIKRSIIKFNCIGADVLIIAFNDSLLTEEGKTEEDKEEKLFRSDNLKDIQPHCVIQKRVSPNPKDINVNEENNEKDCQAIIERI